MCIYGEMCVLPLVQFILSEYTKHPMYRGFVLAVAALGLNPGLEPFAACHSPVSRPVSCHILSCTINTSHMKAKKKKKKKL